MLNNIEKTDLHVYKPKVYKDVHEMDVLLDTENEMFKFVYDEQERAINNQYIQTVDEEGIKIYESMLHIIADPVNETLEFRRQRVLNRLSMSPPFTTIFLRQRLDEILGVGQYDMMFGEVAAYPIYDYPKSGGVEGNIWVDVDIDAIAGEPIRISFETMAFLNNANHIGGISVSLRNEDLGLIASVELPSIDIEHNMPYIPVTCEVVSDYGGPGMKFNKLVIEQGLASNADIAYWGYQNLSIKYTNVNQQEYIPPFTVIVESAVTNFQWYEELAITIGKIKPANIVYITRPLIANTLVNGEVLQYSEMNWNYRLNGNWKLGDKPFASLADRGVIKMATTKSLKKALFGTMGDAAMDAVSKVVLNGTYEITTFTLLEVSTLDDNQCVLTFRYTVPVVSGLGNITRVEVMNSDNEILSQSNVYVPLIQDIELKHTLTIKEGI